MSRSALVLGANGFVGSTLVERLGAAGWVVTRGIRSSSEDLPGASARASQTLRFGSASELAVLVATAEPQVVFNLAAAGVGKHATADELESGNAGVVDALYEGIDPSVTRLVVHAGTWSQYAPATAETPIIEGYPQEPSTAYGFAKALAESTGSRHGRQTGVPFVTLRLFNVYGPGEAPQRLIPYLVHTLRGNTVASLTAGNQVRDFVHVSDVADAFIAVAEHPGPTPEALNVCTGSGTAVADIARLVAAVMSRPEEMLVFGDRPDRPDESNWVVGDPSLMAATIGWSATITVNDGVRDTVRVALADEEQWQKDH